MRSTSGRGENNRMQGAFSMCDTGTQKGGEKFRKEGLLRASLL